MATAFEEALARIAVDGGHVSRADVQRATQRATEEGITLLDALVESGALDGTTGSRLAEEAARSVSGDGAGARRGGVAVDGRSRTVDLDVSRDGEPAVSGNAGVPRAGVPEPAPAAPDDATRTRAESPAPAAPAAPDDATRAQAPLPPPARPDDATRTLESGGAPFLEASGATGSGSARGAAFPVEGWDRYRFVRVIGEGGMGRVFLADDTKLGRQVALKFIRGGEGAPAERFLQEARTQATVEHDNICRIYEVGEVQGRPYIAMQFVDGEPLDVASRDLPLEETLRLTAQVAEAVHAAHRQGLIHRDIKPSNVLVERGADGRLKPYLLDFGLAREQASTGLTMTGAVLGTPQYMAPEQAAGESATLDRRADVYALGATLYALVSGRPPFRGKTLAVLLRQVLEEVPEPLATGGTSIPADVDAIVMKCMRKDPRERYASARDLARDLRRYLDGEPVEARPTGLLYRLRMKAAKNRLAVTVAGIAALLVLVTSAWGAQNAWSAARRARLAQEFGQQVEQIESFARVSYMLPLHDVRPDREEIERRMAAIQARMDELGAVARGPGLYALGRGDLVLGRFGRARERLDAARDAGYDDPQLDYALGRALGELYIEAHDVALRLEDAVARERRLAEIDAQLKRPALEALERGRGSSLEAPEYVAALVALYERKYDEAIGHAEAAWRSRPYQYEARGLQGRIETHAAIDLGLAGDYEGALEGYDRAEAALRDAVTVGRSDPIVYADLCALYPARMKTEFHGLAGDPTEHFEKGLEACDLAATADPGGVDALIQVAALQNRMAEYRSSQGEDGSPLLRASIDTARRILAVDPEREDAVDALASAFAQLARVEIDAGDDPRASLDGAVEAFERALALREEHWRYNDLGIVFKLRAQLDERAGLDPMESLGRSIDAFRRSLDLHPEQAAAWNNLGQAYLNRATFEEMRGDDPGASLDLASEAYESGLGVDPDQMVLHYNLARVLAARAARRSLQGEDPAPLLVEAMAAYQKAIDVNPESAYVAHFRNGLGIAALELARHDRRSGEDPAAHLDRAEAEFVAAEQANPKLFFAPANLALVEITRASHARALEENPESTIESAIVAAERAIGINGQYMPAHDAAIHALLLLVENRGERGMPAGDVVRRGRSAVAAALELQPDRVSTLGTAAELELEISRGEERDGRPGVPALEKARALSERADAAAPESPTAIRVAARVVLEDARRHPGSQQDLEDVIARLTELIDESAGDMEARVLRGALRLELALAAADHAERGDLAAAAHADLDAALAADARLSREFEPLLERARSVRAARP